MKWFSKKNKQDQFTDPKDMSPLEAVTHLCASIQIVDGQSDNEERLVWINTISNLFPEFVDERAEKFMKQALIVLGRKNQDQKLEYTKDILNRIKVLLDREKIELLCLKIAELIEADGMVMTSEIAIADIIKNELGINIIISDDL
tara:strand:- start:50 stop:484 length:435 start_codon:yes stop_codon:yes gene_type:complete